MDLFGVFSESQKDRKEPKEKILADSKRIIKDSSPGSDDNKVSKKQRVALDEERATTSDGKQASNTKSKISFSNNQTDGQSRNKRLKSQALPVVTDAVELETTQEVPASASEALDGSKDDQKLEIAHQLRHEVALPPNYDYTPIAEHKSTNPARTYPFTLDPFQAMSIAAIERHESVLVSAHTSAGKTVVAEYAIAQSLQDKQRVIYTSPIKALSNQKFRELQAEFQDVGLMTGDVTINPEASCLVMTTEILRSMLYRGSEVMREMAWVIFDEIHYMRDKERGVVWEETIILLPDTVRYVFLSATIPNAMQFAEWICKIHRQPCHVVYTNFRPTPLQHYLFPEGGNGIHLVVDEKGNFREENFQKAMGALSEKSGQDPSSVDVKSHKGKVSKGGKKDIPDIFKIIKLIIVKNFNPVIVFSFSKRECESLAMKLSRLEFNNSDERDMVDKVFSNAIGQLTSADQELPQIKSIFPLLKRGIGVHHSGLLPILKEVIELLFQEGLLKVLFATETFSIGLNMPAKTVVFTNVRKFDGKEIRWVSGGEYIQMSGRAGRRGLDDRGIVIMMLNEQMEPAIAKGMVKGVADRLDSAFHLGYNMILNLLRVEGISPEFMLENCFFQFQNVTKVPVMEAQLAELEAKLSGMRVQDEEIVADYYDTKAAIEDYGKDVSLVISHPGNSLKFLSPGRLVNVKVKQPEGQVLDFGWGTVVSLVARQRSPRDKTEWNDHEKYIVSVLVKVSKTTPMHLVRKGDPGLVPGVTPPVPGSTEFKAEVLPVILSSIVEVSSNRLHIPKELTLPKQRLTVMKAIDEVKKKFPDGIPLLDPIRNMNIKDEEFTKLMRKVCVLEAKLAANPLLNAPEFEDLYNQYAAKMEVSESVEKLRGEIKDAYTIIQMEELRNRMRVLRKLDFIDAKDVVELKGRVACEISSGDELLVTELVFSGTFSKLTPEQCASLLSCFVFDDRSDDNKNVLHPDLKQPFQDLQVMAKKIAEVSNECKLTLVVADYIASFKPQLMDVVYQWAKGATFSQICKMTDVFEGSLIRIFRRLEELLRQVSFAAKTIGNDELATKMEKALSLIGRDMVHAASLYL